VHLLAKRTSNVIKMHGTTIKIKIYISILVLRVFGAFDKMGKVNVAFVMCVCVCVCVCVSVHTERLGYRWKDFHAIWYWRIFRKSVEKIQVALKFDKNNGFFTRKTVCIYDYNSLNSSQNKKYFRPIFYRKRKHLFFKVRIAYNIHILGWITFFPKIVLLWEVRNYVKAGKIHR
jgi:hypothetical protein